MKKIFPIVAGEPRSINAEIIAKCWKKLNFTERKKVFVIGNFNLIKSQLNYLKLKIPLKKIKTLNHFDNKGFLNILDVELKFNKPFKIKKKEAKKYVLKCLNEALKIIEKYKISSLVTCPFNKKNLFENNRIGLTEFLSKIDRKKKETVMMIYSEKFAVVPLTNHINQKIVHKKINKSLIIRKIQIILRSYKKIFGKNPKIAITGLNPHNDEFRVKSEENKIILPAVKYLNKKKIKVHGPVPADTIFLKDKIKSFNLIVGMYHDQVLAPFKALNGFDAINITLGLDFLRVAPDHGTGEEIIGKNLADSKSLLKTIKFVFKYGYKA